MYVIRFMEKNSRTEAWSFTVKNIELLSGMIAGSIGILNDYNYLINNTNKNSTKKEYYLDTDIDISEFRLEKYITSDDISLYAGNIKPNHYGIWLRSDVPFHYNLYTFNTINFLDGIIKISEMLNVDPREYIYGSPFDYRGNELIDTKIDEIAIDVPDRYDEILEEQKDNENVIEWLEKDY